MQTLINVRLLHHTNRLNLESHLRYSRRHHYRLLNLQHSTDSSVRVLAVWRVVRLRAVRELRVHH